MNALVALGRARGRSRVLVAMGLAMLLALGGMVVAPTKAHAADVWTATSIDGVWYSFDDEHPEVGATVGYYEGGYVDVTIPSHITVAGVEYAVTSIGEYAFHYASARSVVIPDTVTTIEDYAFHNIGNPSREGLLSATIPDSVVTIGDYAFSADSLTSLELPDSVTTIGAHAFEANQIGSLTIPGSVTTIGEEAFEGNQIGSLTIPDSVTTIGDGAFVGNPLTSLDLPSSLTHIADGVFLGTRLTSVTIPASVTSIGWGAFDSGVMARVDFLGAAPAMGTMREQYPFGGLYEAVPTLYFPKRYEAADESAGYTTPTWKGYDSRSVSTVTFVGNGGSGSMAAQNGDSDAALDTNAFSRRGYTFTGWSTAADGSGTAYPDGAHGAFDADATLYAQWELTHYGISYDLAGGTPGSGPSPTSYTVEDDDIVLPAPTRDGYTFAGWTGTDLSAPSAPLTIFTGSVGDRSYVATWVKNPVEVVFDANGGSGHMLSQTNVATAPLALNVFARAGYVFTGWSTRPDGSGVFYADGAPYAFDAGVTLYAQWMVQVFGISYDLAGGFGPVENPTSYTVEDDAITLLVPHRVGYDFTGWTGTGLSSPTMMVRIPAGSFGDRSYVATWSKSVVTVRFDANGGSGGMDWQDGASQAPLAANAFTRVGYTFAGWNTAADGSGTPYADRAPYPFDVGATLYAQWAATQYPISYDLVGGTAGEVSPSSYTVEDRITLSAPVRAGYTFAGWTGTDLAAPTAVVTIPTGSLGARSYVATWSKNAVTVTFDANGGSGSMDPQNGASAAPLAGNAFTRTGYTFAGWSTAADGSGTSYADGAQYPFDTGTTLYARWTLIRYQISYDLAGGTAGAANPARYTVEDGDLTLSAPTREGYTFAGWTGTDLSSPTMVVRIPAGSLGDRSYVATWTQDAVTVVFDANGGTGTMASQSDAGASSLAANVFTREGYVFTGWNSKADGSGVLYEDGARYAFDADVTLYARWMVRIFAISYDLGGGAESGAGGGAANPTTYTIEDGAITLSAPSRDGYAFAGWAGTDLLAPTTTVTIPAGSFGDRAYMATWEKVPVPVPVISFSKVTLTGVAKVGGRLTVTPSVARATSFTYQWLRGGLPISGATKATYVPTAADRGQRLSVAVTASAPGLASVSSTSAAVTVGYGTLSGAKPTIKGKAKVSKTLKAKAKGWTAGTRLSYRWFVNGHLVKGKKGTRKTLKLTAKQRGKKITVKVTGTKPGYTTLTKKSKATSKVR